MFKRIFVGLALVLVLAGCSLFQSAPTPASAPPVVQTVVIERERVVTATPGRPAAAATSIPQATQAVTSKVVATTVRFDEQLTMTLDEFGRKTRYDDRFPLDGQIWDQSYFEGEIFVANMFAAHDHDFKSQEGCVAAYYQAPKGGGRIRFVGWDGMGFELNAGSGVSLNQAIAAMRETLVRAHGCKPGGIQYHELFRHGDPVK